MEEIRIALLGNSTLDYLSNGVKEECLSYGINASLYNAPYNQYTQEILNPDSGYNAFSPQLTVLFLEGFILFEKLYWEDLKALSSSQLDITAKGMLQNITGLVNKLLAQNQSKILVHNLRTAYHTTNGIMENKLPYGLNRLISKVNLGMEEYAESLDRVYIFDYNGAASYYGSARSMDPKLYFAAGIVLSFPFSRFLAKEYMRYILPVKGLRKKCLVLDLDNTLWGGVAGEDGLSGIQLDISGPGRCYYDFQRQLLSLHARGILLAVCSKNNYADALEIIENHPYMLLKKKHFAALKINWMQKAENLVEIAGDLNVGIDSLVFFDDSPVERELVRTMLPTVAVVDVPEDPAKYCQVLSELIFFESLGLTQEDLDRNRMYQAEKERKEALTGFNSLEDYWAGLEMSITVAKGSSQTVHRIAQLTQKTNQFNMTGRRYTEEDINRLLALDEYMLYTCSACDRFGDYGTVGVAIVRLENNNTFIDNYLMSCRVLGRNIEYAFLSEVIRALRINGFKNIYATFIKTPKNAANSDFYEKEGFRLTASDLEILQFELAAEDKIKEIDYITIKSE